LGSDFAILKVDEEAAKETLDYFEKIAESIDHENTL
jgi:hydrogenase maturation factor